MHKSILITLLCLVVMACQAQPPSPAESFKEEADRFCQLHSIEYWKGIRAKEPDLTIPQMYRLLSQKVQKADFSDEFREVIKELDYTENTSIYLSELYPLAQQKISTKTGTKWECEDYQKFYHIGWKLGGRDDNEKVIEAWLSDEGELAIIKSGVKVIISKDELLSTVKKEKFTDLIIHVGGTANDEISPHVTELLGALKNTTVKKVSIATSE